VQVNLASSTIGHCQFSVVILGDPGDLGKGLVILNRVRAESVQSLGMLVSVLL
jgi:hypothetical protein